MDTGAMPVLMFATDAEASADAVVRARRGSSCSSNRALARSQAPLLTPDASKHSPATVAGEPKRAARQRGHKGGRMKVRVTRRCRSANEHPTEPG
jgi:hypothetical protein